MAIRVDLHPDYLKRALEAQIASIKRANTNEHNPAMKQLREKDIASFQNAINTLTEVK